MTACNAAQKRSAFTLVEILVAMAVFGLFTGALMTTWSALETTAANTAAYAQRQNDQLRVIDYLRRDIRRASGLEIYDGATLVTGTAFGTELRLTLPDYYDDAREDDNAIGTKTAITPTLTSGVVTYGTPMVVRYYITNGAVIRDEDGTPRTLGDSAGAFVLSFSREASGLVRCRVVFDQRMRSGVNRTLRRQIDTLCNQRSQLQL